MRASMQMIAVMVAVIIGGALLTGVVTHPWSYNVEFSDEEPDDLVQLFPGESAFWQYYSPYASFDRPTNAINLIFYGDPERVRQHLMASGDWNVTGDAWTDADDDTYRPDVLRFNGTDVSWETAKGSTRYAYVDATVHGGERGWIDESYQLHDGDYFGKRYHVRAYIAPHPEDSWTIMQAHSEHWDWFSLTHAVDGVEDAQSYIEEDFLDRSFVNLVWRAHLGNGDMLDANGWATVIELALAPLLIAIPLTRRQLRTHLHQDVRHLRKTVTQRHLLLAGAIPAVYLSVRAGGILLERSGIPLPPQAIAGILYPVIAAGLPICAYRCADGMRRHHAFGITAFTFLFTLLVDYSILGITIIPLDILLRNAVFAIALGLVAAGAPHTRVRDEKIDRLVVYGVVLWVVLLVATLYGVV